MLNCWVPTEFGNSTRNDVGVPAEGTLPHVHAAVWEPAPSPPKASLSCALSPLHNGGFFVLAKIEKEAEAITDYLSRSEECSVRTAGFPSFLCS